jgi:hypothetical protein
MKKTVWEIDGGVLTLTYYHDNEEIFLDEHSNAMNSKSQQIALDDDCVSNLVLALGELKALRAEAKADKAISTLREAM